MGLPAAVQGLDGGHTRGCATPVTPKCVVQQKGDSRAEIFGSGGGGGADGARRGGAARVLQPGGRPG